MKNQPSYFQPRVKIPLSQAEDLKVLLKSLLITPPPPPPPLPPPVVSSNPDMQEAEESIPCSKASEAPDLIETRTSQEMRNDGQPSKIASESSRSESPDSRPANPNSMSSKTTSAKLTKHTDRSFGQSSSGSQSSSSSASKKKTQPKTNQFKSKDASPNVALRHRLRREMENDYQPSSCANVNNPSVSLPNQPTYRLNGNNQTEPQRSSSNGRNQTNQSDRTSPVAGPSQIPRSEPSKPSHRGGKECGGSSSSTFYEPDRYLPPNVKRRKLFSPVSFVPSIKVCSKLILFLFNFTEGRRIRTFTQPRMP
jgi:hypothetical protein